MRPQDIEKIARGVAASFVPADSSLPLTGCDSFSNPEAFSCAAFACDSAYECGDLAGFSCFDNFNCTEGFFCYYTFSETPSR